MRISIRDQQAILPALAGFFLTALVFFLYGMVLPEDWDQRFGIFTWPIRFAAQLPIIESFATAASLPKEIVAGFLGLVPWLSPILGSCLFLCLYDRQTYALALAQRERDFLQEPDLLHTLRGLGTVCIVLFFILMLLVLIPFCKTYANLIKSLQT